MFSGVSILANRYFDLAESYENGNGWFFSKDIDAAVAWYARAADAGHPKAYFRLGRIFEERNKLEKALKYYLDAALRSDVEAISSLERLSLANNITAKCYLGIVHENKGAWQNAIQSYTDAIAGQDALAMYRLGRIYQADRKAASGSVVIPQNISEELSWYRKAAAAFSAHALNALVERSSSDAQAAFYVAEMYEKGEGLSKKAERAVEYYRKSSDLGNHNATYQLGKIYESGADDVPRDIVAAVNYYATAACHGHTEAEYDLKQLATYENNDAQYVLGIKYYGEYKKEVKSTITWCIRASEKNHTKATDYITKTDFDADTYLTIAKTYQNGEQGIPKNIRKAIQFYIKASEKGNAEAAFVLGTIYEFGRPGIVVNTSTAFDYYLKAAEQGRLDALPALERLVILLNSKKSEYELGKLYHDVIKNIPLAIKWLKRAAEKGHANALALLPKIADVSSAWAYEIAKLYDNTPGETPQLETAIRYYLIAARKDHAEAKKRLEALAQQRNPEAQYQLGYGYYLHKKDTSNAVRWCMKAADLKHVPASDYVNKTAFTVDIFLMMAKAYETGEEGITKDPKKAIQFYVKASELGSKDAFHRLGQIYQLGELGVTEDLVIACKHYLKAAEQQHKEALYALGRILSTLSNAQLQFELADLYYRVLKDNLAALKWFKRAEDNGNTKASAQLEQIISPSPLYTYELGKLYEGNAGEKANLPKALNLYLVAARKNHAEARKQLEAIAARGDAQTQYMLGYEYYHSTKDFAKAVEWCMRAAEKKHKQATDYLTKTTFGVDIYLKIARTYDLGTEGIARNTKRAVEFYVKADALKSKDAAFRLGQLYEEDGKDLEKDIQKACQYYLKAAQLGHKDALLALERLVLMLGHSDWEFKLGELYQKLKNVPTALEWYKKAADKGYAPAEAAINKEAESSADIAYQMARAYLRTNTPENNVKVFRYYRMALSKKHEKAKEEVEALALAGNAEAQYLLGYAYYHEAKKDPQAAVNWCMKAVELNHAQARTYLTQTVFTLEIYLYLAKTYEEGTKTIKKNNTLAIVFYEKASQLGDKASGLRLGHLYQLEHQGVGRNTAQAWAHYMRVAKEGNRTVLSTLERLALRGSSAQQLELAALYQLPLFYNKDKAKEWYERAVDSGNTAAKKELDKLSLPDSKQPAATTTRVSFSASGAVVLNKAPNVAQKSPLPAPVAASNDATASILLKLASVNGNNAALLSELSGLLPPAPVAVSGNRW